MVSTVRPKANDTPCRPMPTFGNAAASTALPQPPITNQNVPKNSAPYCFMEYSASCRSASSPVLDGSWSSGDPGDDLMLLRTLRREPRSSVHWTLAASLGRQHRRRHDN